MPKPVAPFHRITQIANLKSAVEAAGFAGVELVDLPLGVRRRFAADSLSEMRIALASLPAMFGLAAVCLFIFTR